MRLISTVITAVVTSYFAASLGKAHGRNDKALSKEVTKQYLLFAVGILCGAFYVLWIDSK